MCHLKTTFMSIITGAPGMKKTKTKKRTDKNISKKPGSQNRLQKTLYCMELFICSGKYYQM